MATCVCDGSRGGLTLGSQAAHVDVQQRCNWRGAVLLSVMAALGSCLLGSEKAVVHTSAPYVLGKAF